MHNSRTIGALIEHSSMGNMQSRSNTKTERSVWISDDTATKKYLTGKLWSRKGNEECHEKTRMTRCRLVIKVKILYSSETRIVENWEYRC